MLKAIVEDFGNGGTIDGDLVVSGDLTVSGGGSLSFDEIIEGTQVIDATNTEALLVRKNGDGGDVFKVDSTNATIYIQDGIGTLPSLFGGHQLVLQNNNDSGDQSRLALISGATGYSVLDFGDASDVDAGGIAYQNHASDDLMTLRVNATDFVYIKDSGVGIGAVPTNNLHIEADSGDEGITIHSAGDTGNAITIDANRSSADAGIGTMLGKWNGTLIGYMGFFSGADTTNKDDGVLKFATTPSGGSATVALTIGSDQSSTFSGDILVNNSTPALTLQDSDGSNQTLEILHSGANTFFTSRNGSSNGAFFFRSYNGSSFSTALELDSSQNATFSGQIKQFRDDSSTVGTNDVVIENDGSGDASLKFSLTGATDWFAYVDNSDSDKFKIRRSTSDYLVLTETGNVGINDSSPEAHLTISPSTVGTTSLGGRSINYGLNINTASGRSGVTVKPANNYAIGDDNAGFQWLYPFDDGGNGDFKAFRVSEGATLVDKFYATRDGQGYFASNVGIGTNDPKEKLHVSTGNNSNSGNITFLIGGTEGTNARTGRIIKNTSSPYEMTIRANDFSGTGDLILNDDGGNVGIGSTPKTHLDVQSYQADGITIGADNDANRTRTNSTSKSGGITGVHYTNAEESIRLLGYSSSSSANILLLGGGNGDWNSATDINFYVGANTTTTAGDLRFKLDTNSRISLSNNDAGSGGADSTSGTTILGYIAGDNVTSSSKNNSFIGHASGNRNTSGDENTGVGRYAGLGNFTGNNNTFVGSNAGLSDNSDSHSNNTGVGYSSLKSITTGSENTVVGSLAADALKTGEKNCVVGVNALRSAAFGETGNVAIGHHSMFSLNEGSIGTADNNIAIGQQALLGGAFAGNPKVVNDNIAIGAFALDATSDNNQTGTIAIGRDALGALTSGAGNLAIGYEALKTHTTGSKNIAIGYQSMFDTDAGSNSLGSTENVFIGYQSGSGTWTDSATSYNTGIGNSVMRAACDGATNNTGVGFEALKSVTSGDSNTAVGSSALEDNTTARYNTSVGASALQYNTNGEHNVAIGLSAGRSDASGSNATSPDQSIAIGSGSQFSSTTPTNEIVIGYNAVGGGDNSVVLGNSSVTAVLCASDGEAQVYASAIRFPATQVANSNANALDDYEEGEHTSVITCGNSGTITLDGTNNKLSYVKVGSMVTVNGLLSVSSVSSPDGYFTFSVPFTLGDGTGLSKRCSGSVTVYGVSGLDVTDFVVVGIEAEARIRVYAGNGSSIVNDSANSIIASSAILVGITYFV